MAFGTDIEQYRSFFHSILALLRMAVGDFDYGPGHAGGRSAASFSPIVNTAVSSLGDLYGCTGHLTAFFGGFRPGQMPSRTRTTSSARACFGSSYFSCTSS
jgi:hypothetical protein